MGWTEAEIMQRYYPQYANGRLEKLIAQDEASKGKGDRKIRLDQERRRHPPDNRALLLRDPRDPCPNLLNEPLTQNTSASGLTNDTDGSVPAVIAA
jgi:hypothetical protein